tara:strand:+ start:1298 stop:1840 length:543 start_codon:yes stop_codon:yes gene_type:complete
MIHMNLLPWRETSKAHRKKENLAIISVAVVLASCSVFFVSLVVGVIADKEQSAVQYINKKISSLDKSLLDIKGLEVKKIELLGKIDILQKLQIGRAHTAELFDELVGAIPTDITLLEVRREGDKIAIVGVASSNSAVSQFMRNIERSDLLENARLLDIEKHVLDSANTNKFNMDLKVRTI